MSIDDDFGIHADGVWVTARQERGTCGAAQLGNIVVFLQVEYGSAGQTCRKRYKAGRKYVGNGQAGPKSLGRNIRGK